MITDVQDFDDARDPQTAFKLFPGQVRAQAEWMGRSIAERMQVIRTMRKLSDKPQVCGTCEGTGLAMSGGAITGRCHCPLGREAKVQTHAMKYGQQMKDQSFAAAFNRDLVRRQEDKRA